jgi:hypothetical protein
MRSLALVAMIGIVVAGVIWGFQRLRYRFGPPPALPPATGDLAERAILAYGPESGPGVLRLSPSQLVFTADSGRVLAIERLDVVGVGSTRDLPDRTLTQPVLAITTRADTYFFAVGSPADWERRLT